MQSVNLKMCIHCIHSKSPEQNYQHQSIVAQNNLKEHISTHNFDRGSETEVQVSTHNQHCTYHDQT
jgi:hypothetical protein